MSKEKKSLYIHLLILAAVFIIAGLLFENVYLTPLTRTEIASKVEKKIQNKQAELGTMLFDLKLDFDKDSFYIKNYDKLLSYVDEQVYLFGFENDTATFWNSNRVILSESQVGSLAHAVVELPNCYALWDSISIGNKKLYAISPIEFVYSIENRFIKSYFLPEYKIPKNSLIYLSNLGRTFAIKDKLGEPLLYLDISNVNTRGSVNKILGLTFFLLFILCVWGALLQYISIVKRIHSRNLLILLSFAVIFVIIAFIGNFEYPLLLNYSELFSSTVFAMPGLFKSLGLIFLFSLLWILSAFRFHKSFGFGTLNLFKNVSFPVIMGIVGVELINLFTRVIENSVINFQLQLIKEVDVYSLMAYFIFLLLFGGWFLIINTHAIKISESIKSKQNVLISLISIIVSTLIFAFIRSSNLVLPALIISGVCVVTFAIGYFRQGKYDFLNRFVVILLFSLLGWAMFWQTQDESERSKEETILGNLASSVLKERDLVSEIGLVDKTAEIAADFRVKEMLSQKNPNPEQLLEYLRRFYLGDIWRKYDIQVVLCWPNSVLYINENDENSDCYPYFQGMLNEIGERVNKSNIYYLDNLSGRVNYFAWIKYFEGEENEISLFIDLETRAISRGIGYPELLSENSVDLSSLYDGYCFARYVDGKLVNYTGDYQYNTLSSWIINDTLTQTFNGYIHRFHATGSNEMFVLSKPLHSSVDTLLFLVYLFLYMFIITYMGVFITQMYYVNEKRSRSLASRIRTSVIFILLLSFMLIGATSIYFNVRQYKAKQLEVLKEKNKSVQVALDAFLGQENSIEDIDSREMTRFLQELSNTLYIDINLFNINGHLASTSRPEIFRRELMGRLIAPNAFFALQYQQKPFVLANESLVGLKYLSVYQPISNWDNKLLGFVNLPYFVSSDELSNDVTDFIVVLLNIYLVFVILAVLLTLLLTREITKPLLLIREKISGFRLRGSNEKIEYSGRDEVAQLVEDYNRLVDELEQSAENLASSERSLAWRQMARQIAHEIKNPLTPMKLSIQHLQRARNENDDRFADFFAKTTTTLVEQIDNLSRIASEFSSFSKMPEFKPSKVDLIERAGVAVNLFVDMPNVKVQLKHVKTQILVYADREQLNQVFNNLIKNAIQAIPKDRKGLVVVDISQEKNFAKVKIIDNGKGISVASREKLFEPNFTTKSSGMGLGLAIAKNILINSGGDIWFETLENRGTTFYFTLPLYKNE